MNVLLPLWITLILFSCYGNVGSDDSEEVSTIVYDSSVTPTPEYDYDATFDYYYVTGNYSIQLSADPEPSTTLSADPESSTEFSADPESSTKVHRPNRGRSGLLDANNGCRSTAGQSQIFSILLVSLAALSL
ncbi:uncharacterized protein V3H82_012395 [Fundulus diaphanus]